MTAWLSETASEEVQGNRHIVTIGIKPRAFLLNGSWRAIPDAFSDTGDAALPRGRSGLLTTRMADRLAGQSPQVLIGRGKYHLRMSALGTNNVPGLVYLDGLGREIGRRYNGAWQGADLEWIDIGHRVRKHIYLHAGHPSVFEVRIDGLAGNLVASPRGWDLLDDSGSPVLYATPGYLFRPDDPIAPTIPVQTSIRVQGGKSIYRYVLPQGNLAGYALDPTWTSQPGAAEGMDTWIQQDNPNTNYSTDGRLYTTWYSSVIYRSLMEFNVSSIPSSATVTTTTLDLKTINDFGATAVVDVHRVTQSWIEASVTWNKYDGTNAWASAGGDFDGTIQASQTFVVDGNFSQSILALVRNWVSGAWANSGLLLKQNTESGPNHFIGFASSDNVTASQRPSLTVVYSASSGGRPRWWLLHRP